jgi:hypothetical protein
MAGAIQKRCYMAAILPSTQASPYVINATSSLLSSLSFSCYSAITVLAAHAVQHKIKQPRRLYQNVLFRILILRMGARESGAPAGQKSLPNKKKIESFSPPLILLYCLVLDLNPDSVNEDRKRCQLFLLSFYVPRLRPFVQLILIRYLACICILADTVPCSHGLKTGLRIWSNGSEPRS